MKINHTARIRLLDGLATLADVVLLNLCIVSAWALLPSLISRNSLTNPAAMFMSWNLAYAIGIAILPIHRIAASACLRTGVVMALLHHAVVYCSGLPTPSAWQFTLTCLALPIWLFCSRIASLCIIRALSGKRKVAFVGDSDAIRQLREKITLDPTAKVMVVGEFATPEAAIGTTAEELYCSCDFESERLERLSEDCENHIVRLYFVPESPIRNRHLILESQPQPLFVARPEPLRGLSAQIVKRTFDIAFSLAFLLTVFPFAFVIIGFIIKRTSPGPIFFSQRRNGLDGRDFNCLKFRTMRNDPACDGKAATENDDRKYPFGDFLRRHNLDELPQFINVLKGEMSIVGPRPHATWTTENYRSLVKRYMVRLYAKPGITGWAQVNGCRGETKTTEDMARRIRLDIWYITHWSFGLDIRIIYLTVRNMLIGERGNAY